MKIYSLTKERVEELMAEMNAIMDKYNTLKEKTSFDLWEEDIKEFETQYSKTLRNLRLNLLKSLNGDLQMTQPVVKLLKLELELPLLNQQPAQHRKLKLNLKK